MPIIPIAAEPHLEEFFAKEMNRIESGFGDVQLLSMYSTDDSAIPYLQKLQRDLKTILANDAEAKKIRNAFATRFFELSKKRSQYAN